MTLPFESPFTEAKIRAHTFGANLIISHEVNQMIERETFLLEWLDDCQKVGMPLTSKSVTDAHIELRQIKTALDIVGTSREAMLGVTA
jgi:hypothetical protein